MEPILTLDCDGDVVSVYGATIDADEGPLDLMISIDDADGESSGAFLTIPQRRQLAEALLADIELKVAA